MENRIDFATNEYCNHWSQRRYVSFYWYQSTAAHSKMKNLNSNLACKFLVKSNLKLIKNAATSQKLNNQGTRIITRLL